MKKIFSLTLLFIVSSTMVALAYFYFEGSSNPKTLAGHNWKFYSLVAEDVETSHYVSTMYENAEYNFAADHTYTGTFFGMRISGTWELNNDILVLNKNTNKEEAYMVSEITPENFVLKTTEKGKAVAMQFVKM